MLMFSNDILNEILSIAMIYFTWDSIILLFRVVVCPSLTYPNNGIMTCSLGDDGTLSDKDTCSFTCNTGYELIGSDARTCQSDGSWSGSEATCNRG